VTAAEHQGGAARASFWTWWWATAPATEGTSRRWRRRRPCSPPARLAQSGPRCRKATGRSAAQVKTALAAGGLSSRTRDSAGDMTAQLDLDQLALRAEVDGDP